MRVGIIGAGVVGAAIAYELSQVPGLNITVFDQRSPNKFQGTEATGAALGVLMVALSSRPKGQHLQLRVASIKRYETLIPELEDRTRQSIPYNRQGILELCFDSQAWEKWQQLLPVRQSQGLHLELLSREQVWATYPHLQSAQALTTGLGLVGGVYAPQDRQVQPIALTTALIQVAQSRGVNFVWETAVHILDHQPENGSKQRVTSVICHQARWELDWLIIAAGTGSYQLTTTLNAPVEIYPVLGQGLQVLLPAQLPTNCPVIQGEDVHLVPVGPQELWVGATVEFSPPEQPLGPPVADASQRQRMWHQAVQFWPALAEGKILRTWSGLRPRPQGRAAPVIERLSGYENVILASGHYRNGILLAPITALRVREWLVAAPADRQ